jgi:rhodanese-related sulfurtransferase
VSSAPARSIPATEAIPLVGNGTLWLLDVREAFEWDSGHVPDATHIPLGELGMRQGELPEDATIAVICHSGYRSRMVADALADADYDVVDIAGGIVAWQASGGALASAVSGPGDDAGWQSR